MLKKWEYPVLIKDTPTLISISIALADEGVTKHEWISLVVETTAQKNLLLERRSHLGDCKLYQKYEYLYYIDPKNFF